MYKPINELNDIELIELFKCSFNNVEYALSYEIEYRIYLDKSYIYRINTTNPALDGSKFVDRYSISLHSDYSIKIIDLNTNLSLFINVIKTIEYMNNNLLIDGNNKNLFTQPIDKE